MKPKSLLLFCCLTGLINANAQRPFITLWKTNNPGVSANNQIIFRGTGVNYSIKWINVDSAADTGNTIGNGTDTITFAAQGVYEVDVTPGDGTFTAIKGFNYIPGLPAYGDGKKLVSVEQWGDIRWTTFDSAFYNCFGVVINATDVPDLRQVTDMSYAFFACVSFKDDPEMSNWDVSHVTNMQGMFSGAEVFNQPIDNWNVSHVTNMNGMFADAKAFNQPIGNWDVGKVVDMGDMFSGAHKFNQDIGNWNVSNVTSMIRMFDAASAFNKPIGSWNVSNVTNMGEMFREASKFNQPVGNWNVSNLRIAGAMFYAASVFNQPIGNWNVSNVTDMEDMFRGAIAFNQPLGNWNLNNVTATDRMFQDAVAFNQPIGNWNVSNVGTMNGMFWGASKFNQPIGNWNVSNVAGMAGMFYDAYAFNQPINTWDVSNVIFMASMFRGAEVFNQPLDKWNVSNVDGMDSMFAGATGFNQPINTWNVNIVDNMSGMFSGASAFNQSIGNWNVSHVNNMSGMFNNAYAFNQDISSWNVSKVYDMREMFSNAKKFNQVLGKWNLKAVFYLNNMLDSSGMDCNNYSRTLRSWANGISTPNQLILGAANLSYDSAFAHAAHDSLTYINRWIIRGDKEAHCSVVLSVSLLAFSVVQQGNMALLTWSVANAINTKGYFVERSTDGLHFNTIGFVADNGKQTVYTYIDNLINGKMFYRIKEADNDGKYMYSNVEKIEVANFTWKINGNPVHNSYIELMLNSPANVSIQIVSSNGNIIKTIKKGGLVMGNYNIPLDMDNLAAGLYIVRLIMADKIFTSSVIKQ